MDLSKIQSNLESAKFEIDQLVNGKKISASRARAALMKLKKESDVLRKAILLYSKALPVKHKAPQMTIPDVVIETKNILEHKVNPTIVESIVSANIDTDVKTEAVKAKPKPKSKKVPVTKKA
jgi:hypothetical protein